jgi:predicted nucleic acid-binding protein
MGKMIAQNIIKAIIARPNTMKLDPHFQFRLIEQDVDDNKFVDCAIVANAEYIVTEDKHFKVLETIDFPKVAVIGLDTFLDWLMKS